MKKIVRLLDGPEDIGRGLPFWAIFCAVLALFIAAPSYLSEFAAYNVSDYLLNIPMALGVCILGG